MKLKGKDKKDNEEEDRERERERDGAVKRGRCSKIHDLQGEKPPKELPQREKEIVN